MEPAHHPSPDPSGSFFSSPREKRYWLLVLLVVLGITISLFFGQALLPFLQSQDLQAGLFLTGMALTAGATLGYGLRKKAGKWEWFLLMGILAVYLMSFLRLGLAERSHLIEYSVLALLIHQALAARQAGGRMPQSVPFWAIILSFGISLLDELIQIGIPYRVFDPEDILFNGLAIAGAIGAISGLRYLGKLRQKKPANS